MMNILIVDDDENVLIRLERTLEAEGYSTTTAWSWQEALSIARKSNFDILLVDEHLADLESAIVVDKLRQLQPRACLLLLHAQRKCNKSSHSGKEGVCKWDDHEVMAGVRNSLAA
jgi:DNA-binding response OmpR family regulator